MAQAGTTGPITVIILCTGTRYITHTLTPTAPGYATIHIPGDTRVALHYTDLTVVRADMLLTIHEPGLTTEAEQPGVRMVEQERQLRTTQEPAPGQQPGSPTTNMLAGANPPSSPDKVNGQKRSTIRTVEDPGMDSKRRVAAEVPDM